MSHELEFDTDRPPGGAGRPPARRHRHGGHARHPGRRARARSPGTPPGCLVVDLGVARATSTARGSSCSSACTAPSWRDGVELIVVAPDGSNAARLLGLVAMSDIGEVRRTLAEALHRCAGRE